MLHAPAAGFGETEFYPDFIDKAAVLIVRLAKNHPLPDGNKRAAWVAPRLFIEINDWTWNNTPAVDDAERAVLAIAAGTWSQDDASAWLRRHLAPTPTGSTFNIDHSPDDGGARSADPSRSSRLPSACRLRSRHD